jgi:hypothetical protein
MYDDYMLCKVTLGVLKGAPKLNVLLLLLLITAVCPYENSQNLHNNNVHTVSLITYNLHPPCLHFPPSSFFVY